VDDAQQPAWGTGMFADAAEREADRPPSANGRIGPLCSRRPMANGSNGDGGPLPNGRIDLSRSAEITVLVAELVRVRFG
jgi:hypothetical protein